MEHGQNIFPHTEIQAPPGDQPGGSGCPRDRGAVWQHTWQLLPWPPIGVLWTRWLCPLVDSPTLYEMKANPAVQSCSRLELTQHMHLSTQCPVSLAAPKLIMLRVREARLGNPMGSQDWLAPRTRSCHWCPPPAVRGHSRTFISGSAHRVTAALLVLALPFQALFSSRNLLVHNVRFLVRIPQERAQWASLAGQRACRTVC